MKANPRQKGDAALKAAADQPWDQSVQSLVAFPRVLEMMGAQPDCVQHLGDAFLASSKDVLDSATTPAGPGAEDGQPRPNPGVLDIVMRSPLGQSLGRERMLFNLEQAVARYESMT